MVKSPHYKIAETKRLEALAGCTVEDAYEAVETLTPKERDVLSLLAKGLRREEIAARMKLSGGSVHNYTSKIRFKLRAGTNARCVALWFLRHTCD